MIGKSRREIVRPKLARANGVIEKGEVIEMQQFNVALYESIAQLEKLSERILDILTDMEDMDITQEMTESSNIRSVIQGGLLRHEAA